MTAAPPPAAADAAFRALLQQLLRQQPVAAQALRQRPADEAPTALLEVARRHAPAHMPLVLERIAGAAQLADRAERALCLLEGGVAALVEIRADGACSIQLGAAPAPRQVRREALEQLFPCMVAYLRSGPAPTGAAVSDGWGPPATWRAAATAVYLRVASQLLGLSTPIAMLLIIDKVVTSGSENTLMVLVVGVGLLTLFQYLFLAAGTLHATREVETRALAARGAAFAALVESPGAAGLASAGWDVIQNCAESQRYRVETRAQFYADCLYVSLLALLMYAFSPLLLAVSLLFVPIYLGVGAVSARATRRYATLLSVQRSQLSQQYHEAVAAADTVRCLDLAAHLEARWQALDRRAAAARWRLAAVHRLSTQLVELTQKVSLLGVMLLGVGSVIAGGMTLGQYIAFNLLSMQLAVPLLRLAAFRRDSAEQRLRDQSRQRLADACEQQAWPISGALPFPDQGPLSVRVSDVLVGGDGAAAMPLSFTLRSGAWLGVCGPSGCGKTTLLGILAGLRAPAQGAVLVDGVPLGHYDAPSRARQLRLVCQQPVIYSGSIAENIALGDPAAAPQLIVTVAAVCGLGELLARLPDHLDTQIGAAGQPLSGGEQQRIVIARAVLSRPRVLLLDEATAALDAASERLLLGNLRRFLTDAAVVVVSHRASSLSGCEEIIDLGRPRAAAAAPPRAAASPPH